jgi:hypothetical protein
MKSPIEGGNSFSGGRTNLPERLGGGPTHAPVSVTKSMAEGRNGFNRGACAYTHKLLYSISSLYWMILDQVNIMQDAAMIRIVQFHRAQYIFCAILPITEKRDYVYIS